VRLWNSGFHSKKLEINYKRISKVTLKLSRRMACYYITKCRASSIFNKSIVILEYHWKLIWLICFKSYRKWRSFLRSKLFQRIYFLTSTLIKGRLLKCRQMRIDWFRSSLRLLEILLSLLDKMIPLLLQ